VAESFNPLVPVAGMTIDQARALARERFKTLLSAGEPVGGCACHDESQPDAVAVADGSAEVVAGVRFRDSGRTYYFRVGMEPVEVGDWVVVETRRGREAGRVIIAPQQIAKNSLQGEVTPIVRVLDAEDIARMESMRGESARAVKECAALARSRRLPIKVISADYSFDGALLVLNYSVPERERNADQARLREFAHDCADALHCRVELRQVGPRDEARLLGGVGRCGRTLCCASWLPVFPEISMNMAKTQDLPLNPSKVSGVCGRLLCCLSYENEQYKQMKTLMPRLGQPVETQAGPGVVVAMQLLRELVTVRLDDNGTELVLGPDEIGKMGDAPPRQPAPPRPVEDQRPQAAVAPVDAAPVEDAPVSPAETAADGAPEGAADAPRKSRRRRRRRSGSGGQGNGQAGPPSGEGD
jgi:cell fate regulator YaaT (PSP1 superfamily)